MPASIKVADTDYNFDRIATAIPGQWLYMVGEDGVVYSEDQNRFAGLCAAGVSAYRAFDLGVHVDDLERIGRANNFVSSAAEGLEAIYALSQGIFPITDNAPDWPTLNPSRLPIPSTANIEIHGIPILLEYPEGPLGDLCRDYFRSCVPSTQTARCHLSAQLTEQGWGIYVNGSKFYSLQREEQLGLGLMHATRSLLYAEGEYDVAFHAAMVADGDCGLMLCAPRECGKSTLSAYLVSGGLNLLTDEPALLDVDTRSVAPLRLPLSLKQGSWSVLPQRWVQLPHPPIHLRSDGIRICLVHPSPGGYATRPRRLTHIVFSQYSASLEAKAEWLSPVRTLSLLNEGGMLLGKHLAREQFEAFLKIVCEISAYKIRYTSLEEAHQMLRQIGCLVAD